MELLESQKSSFSIFPILKRLNKIKKDNKNHWKTPKLVSQSLDEATSTKAVYFFGFSLNLKPFRALYPAGRGANTGLHLSSNISKTVKVNVAFTEHFQRVFSKLFNDMQVDRLYTCGSVVIDV